MWRKQFYSIMAFFCVARIRRQWLLAAGGGVNVIQRNIQSAARGATLAGNMAAAS